MHRWLNYPTHLPVLTHPAIDMPIHSRHMVFTLLFIDLIHHCEQVMPTSVGTAGKPVQNLTHSIYLPFLGIKIRLLRRSQRLLICVVKQPPSPMPELPDEKIEHTKLFRIIFLSSTPKHARTFTLPTPRMILRANLRSEKHLLFLIEHLPKATGSLFRDNKTSVPEGRTSVKFFMVRGDVCARLPYLIQVRKQHHSILPRPLSACTSGTKKPHTVVWGLNESALKELFHP